VLRDVVAARYLARLDRRSSGDEADPHSRVVGPLGADRDCGGGGSWRPFVSGYRFLDDGHKLQSLAEAPAAGGSYSSEPSGQSPLPYAFVASS